jgi:hypothetical protein
VDTLDAWPEIILALAVLLGTGARALRPAPPEVDEVEGQRRR